MKEFTYAHVQLCLCLFYKILFPGTEFLFQCKAFSPEIKILMLNINAFNLNKSFKSPAESLSTLFFVMFVEIKENTKKTKRKITF